MEPLPAANGGCTPSRHGTSATTITCMARRLTLPLQSVLAAFFARSRREQYVEQYILREHARGRRLEEILADPYVRNRTSDAERARLLERPELVAALRAQTSTE